MMDKPKTAEVELPPPCHDCRSLHKKYGSCLCARRQARHWWLSAWNLIPGLNRLLPAWECDLRKYETVEDIEKEEKS